MRYTVSEKNSVGFLNRCFRILLFLGGILTVIVPSPFVPVAMGAEAVLLHKKDVPAFTFKNLSPPYKDYDYFQNSEFVPFEPRASSFSLINAWWLAEASTLVYADETYVNQRFSKAGLKRVKFFNRSGTQCFIASNSRFAIVAFRGSQIWKRTDGFDPGQMIADFKTNIDIRLTDWIGGGRVHNGFKKALEDVWEEILPEISNLKKQGVIIWVTGHSLGAALATLAADRLQDAQGLYTFGSPRVGDQGFQRNFRPNAFRIVNGNDVVATVPAKDPYRHVGEPIFIDKKGRVHYKSGSADQSDDAFCLKDSSDSDRDEKATKSGSSSYIPALIRDHIPVLYSIYLWNESVDCRMFCSGE